MLCARLASTMLGAHYAVVPVIPWLPAIPWLAYIVGATLIALAAGLAVDHKTSGYAAALGSIFIVCALSVGLRTVAFEPLAIGSLAWLMPGSPGALSVVARFVLALSLVVFGVDQFFGLHPFWMVFFGVAFVAAGIAFALGRWRYWAAMGAGAMFAIWVVAVHLPRALGLYGVPGTLYDPSEWSSLFSAIALWGGLWSV